MDDDEIKAVIETAHALGLKVAAHAHGKQAIDHTIGLGVDSIEHGSYADAGSYRLFKQHGSVRVVYAAANLLDITQAQPPKPILPLGVAERVDIRLVLTALDAS